MVKRVLLLAGILVLCSSVIMASITVDELIKKNIDAKGGMEKLKAVKSMKVTAKFATQGLEGPAIVYSKRPNFFKLEVTIQGLTLVQDHLTIYSPIGGIVIHKNATEGMYVKTGSRIYTIADLSSVWIKLDAYESDLAWIRYGQTVEFEAEAYAGRKFKGKIAFIDPVLNPVTRTVKIRVNVPNKDRKLKPEMFVRAIIRSRLSSSGKVVDEDLMGKWISPMHPEIIKNRPGKCDKCGMPLVRAEELGYLRYTNENSEKPLVIPASAPLLTGTRAIVYLSLPGKKGTFAARQVTLGPRAGDYYIVTEGLSEGEQVVVNGSFKIDSDLQIQGKPSMMNPDGGDADTGNQHHGEPGKMKTKETKPKQKPTIPRVFQTATDQAALAYFSIQDALSRDNLKNAQNSSADLLKKLTMADMKLLQGEAHIVWMGLIAEIKTSTQKLQSASDIKIARAFFEKLTKPLETAISEFGSKKTTVYRFHCPMALENKGAYWLQNHEHTRNPYFGASMLVCKDSVEILVAGKKNK